ncbi:MAG: tetratricopeptide repeat protein [Singulisphaera sp.]
MFRRALAIELETLGEGHPDTAGSYNSWARASVSRGSMPRPRHCTGGPWRSARGPGRGPPLPPRLQQPGHSAQ